jgi:hypothetical protein
MISNPNENMAVTHPPNTTLEEQASRTKSVGQPLERFHQVLPGGLIQGRVATNGVDFAFAGQHHEGRDEQDASSGNDAYLAMS